MWPCSTSLSSLQLLRTTKLGGLLVWTCVHKGLEESTNQRISRTSDEERHSTHNRNRGRKVQRRRSGEALPHSSRDGSHSRTVNASHVATEIAVPVQARKLSLKIKARVCVFAYRHEVSWMRTPVLDMKSYRQSPGVRTACKQFLGASREN